MSSASFPEQDPIGVIIGSSPVYVERRAPAGMGRTGGSSNSGIVCGVQREFRLISERVLRTLRHVVLCNKKLVRRAIGTCADRDQSMVECFERSSGPNVILR